jgi:hypothetical protein
MGLQSYTYASNIRIRFFNEENIHFEHHLP